MQRVLVMVVVAACGTPGAAPEPDARPNRDAACDKLVHGVDLCPFTASPPLMFVADQILDTNGIAPCTILSQLPPEPPACLIFAQQITIPAGVHIGATGQLPIIFASESDIVIDGTLDVSSISTRLGSGGTYPLCVEGPLPGMIGGVGTGGAAGGSFGGLGGKGGKGAGGGALGGGPGPTTTFVPPASHGGCHGQPGTNGVAPSGSPGGGVWLLALGNISVTGSVSANGQGGFAANVMEGGSGAGSGGFILLASPASVVVNGGLFANGGGGGEGGAAATAGLPGSDGGNAATAAAGGTGGAGADGGVGGAKLVLGGGNGVDGAAGGGGGGGGAGIIAIDGPLTFGGESSPMFSTFP